MERYVPVAGYLLAITATIVLWDANIDSGWKWVGVGIWGCASLVLGALTGRIGSFLWAFAAIPIAIPFGAPDDYQWSEPIGIWWPVAINSIFAAGLIFVAALGRQVRDGRST